MCHFRNSSLLSCFIGRRRARLILSVVVALVVSSAALAQDQNAAQLLAPPDTSSPRATLRNFITSADEIYIELGRSEPTLSRQREMQHRVAFLLRCLDLSQQAPSIAAAQGREAAVSLKEIFDRIPLPPDADIPDFEEVRAAGISRWRIPGTEIALVKISEGERAGEFLFSADTVERAKEFYQRVRNLPYKPDAGSKGLYEAYCLRGGWMIPRGLVNSLPPWALAAVADHAVWQWASGALLIALAAGIVVGMIYLYRLLCPDSTRVRAQLLRVALPLVVIGISSFVEFFLTYQIRLSGDVLTDIKLALRSCTFVAAILAVFFALNSLSDLVIGARRLRPGAIDSQLVRLGFRVLTFMVVAWLTIVAADYMGIPVTPLMACLGASGLAVALASQHTVENLIAGIMLFADKPVRIGDVCQFGHIKGTVEEIGLRSTRIRGIDRSVISIPNAEFAKLQLVNYSRRDHILLRATLQLRYDTTADQLRFVLAELRSMLARHPRIEREPIRVRFIAYGEWSLDVELFAFARTHDWGEFLSIQEDVLLRVMDIVNESGSGFAFPTQMQYTADDTGVDATRTREAESKVKSWREAGLLQSAGFFDDAARSSLAAGVDAATATPAASGNHAGQLHRHHAHDTNGAKSRNAKPAA